MKLHEATQFIPNEINVARLLKMYAVELIDFRLANSGIENCTVLITSKADNFVLRIYRQDKKTDADILQEVSFVRFLGDNDLPVATVLPNQDGENISRLIENDTTWQAVLMQQLPGKHAEHYSDSLIADLANIQANMHILADSYRGDILGQEIKILEETHFIKLIPNRTELSSDCRQFIDRAEQYRVELSEVLPKGLCHLDFDNGNVLSKDGRVTAVLDFDDLMLAPYVMCLAYTLWDVAYDTGLQGSKKYVNHYVHIRKLSEIEKSYIIKIMLFRHYVIGCKDIADNQMDDATLKHYLDMETELLSE